MKAVAREFHTIVEGIMAQEGRRVEVRMGSFACTIEGYDDPISKLKEVMTLVQQMVSETPALVDVSPDIDNAELQEALDGQDDSVVVRNDAPGDDAADDILQDAGVEADPLIETPVPAGAAEPASETDGDFTLAAAAGAAATAAFARFATEDAAEPEVEETASGGDGGSRGGAGGGVCRCRHRCRGRCRHRDRRGKQLSLPTPPRKAQTSSLTALHTRICHEPRTRLRRWTE